MIERSFKIGVNAGFSVAPVIHVNQYDHDEVWYFTLIQEDGQVYTPSTGAIVGIKSDGNVIINSGTVNSSGQIVINETQQMTAAVGNAVYELVFDAATHGTANFVVRVEPKPGDNATVSDSDISLIEEAIVMGSRIVAYGSPLVATTASQMTNRQNVYVYTGSESGYTNGHWYYWNGSAWTDGGVYNAVAVNTDKTLSVENMAADGKATGDAIADLKNAIDDISIINHNIFNVNEALEGYYSNSKELLPTETTPSIPLKHVNIPLNVNDIVRFSVDSLVSVYNIGNVLSSDLTPLSIIRNGSAYASYTKYDDYYEVTALHDDAKYLAITFPVNNSGTFMITKNNAFPSDYEPFGNQLDAEALPDNSIEQIKIKGAVIDRTPSMTNGGYISVTDGTINALTTASYSDYIDIDNVSDVYTALSQYVSIGYYDKDKTWLSGFDDASQTRGIANWFTLNPPSNAKYVRVSNRTNVLDNSAVICREKAFNTLHTLKNRTYTPDNIIGSMFKKSIHVGDSLTWSQVYTSASANRQAFQTYPDIFGKLCGIPSSLIGTPGAMPSTWWNAYSSQLTEHGLYVVFLGTNGGLTDTVDTDCAGDDISAYANTETGYYGRILQTIKANNDVAVLVKCFGGGGSSLEETNNAIKSLGVRYDCPVIDINESERTNRYYHYFPDKTGYNALHFNDLGYDWMANVIFRKINALTLPELWLIYPKQ